MAIYSGAFAARVSEILTERRLSPYDVQRMSGGAISHQTVRNMQGGVVPSSDFILAFAEAVADQADERAALADELLRLAQKRLRYHLASVMYGVPVGA